MIRGRHELELTLEVLYIGALSGRRNILKGDVVISYEQFSLAQLRTEYEEILKENPATYLCCGFTTGIFHISLGWDFSLLETRLKVLDKNILFFDLLSPSRVSISRVSSS